MPEELNQEKGSDFSLDSALNIVEVLVKRRWFIIIPVAVVNLAMLVYLLLAQPIFTARTTILPMTSEDQSPLSNLAGGAGQFLGLGLSSGSDKSSLHTSILRSRRIVHNVLQTSFHSEETGKDELLLDMMGIKVDSVIYKLDVAYGTFINSMQTITVDKESGIMIIEIDSNSPKLSAEVTKTVVAEFDDYMRLVEREKATENRIFIEGRLEETLGLLQTAEEELKSFLEANKRIERSPELQLQSGRLLREIKVQEEVFLTLKKQFEIIKIDEVKSLPMVRVLDEAIPPLKKSKPKRTKIMITTIFLTVAFGIGGAFTIEYVQNIRSDTDNVNKIKNILMPIIEDYLKFKSFFGTKSEEKTPSDIEIEYGHSEDDPNLS